MASAIPKADEIEVELCAAPKGSYSLSCLFVKPERPPPCLSVLILSFLPVKIYEDNIADQQPRVIYH